MLNQPLDRRANRTDISFAKLKYTWYLISEPFVHVLNYGGTDSPIYDLNLKYFINLQVDSRLKKERENRKGGLEQVA